ATSRTARRSSRRRARSRSRCTTTTCARRSTRSSRARSSGTRSWCFARTSTRTPSPTCGTCRARRRSPPERASADGEQLDLEHERRVGRDRAREAPRAVAERRRDGELALAADAHALHALVPARDHLARAEAEAERRVADAGVELLAVGEPARVVHLDA